MREAGILRDNSGQAVGVNVSVAESLGLDGLREAMIELAVLAKCLIVWNETRPSECSDGLTVKF